MGRAMTMESGMKLSDDLKMMLFFDLASLSGEECQQLVDYARLSDDNDLVKFTETINHLAHLLKSA